MLLNETVPLTELDTRRERFLRKLSEILPTWETVILVDHVNQLYFTGTIQDGIVTFQRDGSRHLFVRRSIERALDESTLPRDEILPMRSYHQIATTLGENIGVTCVEKSVLPLATLERLQRSLKMTEIQAVDGVIARVRSVKTPWELRWLERTGELHHHFLTAVLPTLFREGMTECELVADVYSSAVKHGYQGVTRFAMFQTEVAVGQYCFGTSSLYPTNFNGPGGSRGMSAAVPFVGSRTLRLECGQSIFADMAFGVNGYHTDKTQVFFFRGGQPDMQIPEEALSAHARCWEIQRKIAERLRPGEIPARIYQDVMAELEAESACGSDFLQNFQGFGSHRVKFLGHGIGLQVDEFPVIATGFNEPLEENMLLAVEPKRGIEGFGTVGVEDTFVVTPEGGRCLTGGASEIISVD